MTETAARDEGRVLPDWVWGAGVMVAMILLSRVSDVASLAGLPIKPWKPGGGLALGMMMVRGMHLLPWVLLGQAGAGLVPPELTGIGFRHQSLPLQAGAAAARSAAAAAPRA